MNDLHNTEEFFAPPNFFHLKAPKVLHAAKVFSPYKGHEGAYAFAFAFVTFGIPT